MYVCVCKAISEDDLKNQLKKKRCPTAELLKKMGIASDCGSCASRAQEVVNEVSHPRSQRSQNVFSPSKDNK